ncbi:Twinfilin-1 [Quaeritorhiza haematococci]|nr:Twinfilin-1 [Quaeritorhiza haematococci]
MSVVVDTRSAAVFSFFPMHHQPHEEAPHETASVSSASQVSETSSTPQTVTSESQIDLEEAESEYLEDNDGSHNHLQQKEGRSLQSGKKHAAMETITPMQAYTYPAVSMQQPQTDIHDDIDVAQLEGHLRSLQISPSPMPHHHQQVEDKPEHAVSPVSPTFMIPYAPAAMPTNSSLPPPPYPGLVPQPMFYPAYPSSGYFQQQQPTYLAPVCRYFQQGRCWAGPHCRFSHIIGPYIYPAVITQPTRNQQPEQTQVQILPTRKMLGGTALPLFPYHMANNRVNDVEDAFRLFQFCRRLVHFANTLQQACDESGFNDVEDPEYNGQFKDGTKSMPLKDSNPDPNQGIRQSKTGHTAAPELITTFTNALSSEDKRAIKVIIENETLVATEVVPVEGNWEEDFSLLQGHLEEKVPSFILYRLDSKQPTGDFDWLLLQYVPDGSKVRDKMLYASSKATLTKELGDSKFTDTMYATHLNEVTLEIYRKHLIHKEASAPLTAKEQELRAVKLAEQVDTAQESVELDQALSVGGPDEIAAAIPPGVPRFVFYSYKHTFENNQLDTLVFAYVCPPKSKVKERMLYSSSKSTVLAFVEEQFSFVVDKKFELDEGSEISEDFLMEEIHPGSRSANAAAPTLGQSPKPGFRKPSAKSNGACALDVGESELFLGQQSLLGDPNTFWTPLNDEPVDSVNCVSFTGGIADTHPKTQDRSAIRLAEDEDGGAPLSSSASSSSTSCDTAEKTPVMTSDGRSMSLDSPKSLVATDSACELPDFGEAEIHPFRCVNQTTRTPTSSVESPVPDPIIRHALPVSPSTFDFGFRCPTTTSTPSLSAPIHLPVGGTSMAEDPWLPFVFSYPSSTAIPLSCVSSVVPLPAQQIFGYPSPCFIVSADTHPQTQIPMQVINGFAGMGCEGEQRDAEHRLQIDADDEKRACAPRVGDKLSQTGGVSSESASKPRELSALSYRLAVGFDETRRSGKGLVSSEQRERMDASELNNTAKAGDATSNGCADLDERDLPCCSPSTREEGAFEGFSPFAFLVNVGMTPSSQPYASSGAVGDLLPKPPVASAEGIMNTALWSPREIFGRESENGVGKKGGKTLVTQDPPRGRVFPVPLNPPQNTAVLSSPLPLESTSPAAWFNQIRQQTVPQISSRKRSGDTAFGSDLGSLPPCAKRVFTSVNPALVSSFTAQSDTSDLVEDDEPLPRLCEEADIADELELGEEEEEEGINSDEESEEEDDDCEMDSSDDGCAVKDGGRATMGKLILRRNGYEEDMDTPVSTCEGTKHLQDPERCGEISKLRRFMSGVNGRSSQSDMDEDVDSSDETAGPLLEHHGRHLRVARSRLMGVLLRKRAKNKPGSSGWNRWNVRLDALRNLLTSLKNRPSTLKQNP